MPTIRSAAPLAMFIAAYGCSSAQPPQPSATNAPPRAAAPAALTMAVTMDGVATQALRARHGVRPERAAASTSIAPERDEAPLATSRYAARHQPEAQVLSEGGTTIETPRVVPVFYAGDPKAGTLVDFGQRLVTSAYWSQVTSEYGVGPGVQTAPVFRNETAPPTIFDTDIEGWLKAKLDANDPLLPAPDDDTIYMLYFPPGTVVEFAPYAPGVPPSQSCKSFGAYHSEVKLASGRTAIYAVMPRCDQGYRHYTGVEQLTLAPAHELIEAVSDPHVLTGPAYDFLDFAGSAYALVQGGEIGDMCEFVPVSVANGTDVGYPVQRIWSNRSAAAGHDPCLPALGPVYFNATPVVGGTEAYSGYYSRGITLPPGGSVTVDVQLFSDGPTDPWALSAKETDAIGSLTFAWDATTGKNGDVRHLTITRGQDGNPYGTLRAEIDSTLNGATNAWPLVIGYGAPPAAASSYAAPHPATAQLVSPYPGAPIVTAPRVVPVVFAGDAAAGVIADFTARLTTGAYWSALAEYGIGAGSAVAPITLSDAVPATWAGGDLAAWFAAKLDAGDPALPPRDPSTVYALFLPPGTTVTTSQYPGAPIHTSCVDFDAYNDEAPLASGATAPIAVVPRCASFRGLSGDDALTVAAGRALANAVTNPSPAYWPGLSDVPFDGSELGVTYGAEVASLCASSATPNVRPADLGGHLAPRLWSNATAAASHDPCRPSTGGADPYFNVAPITGGTTGAYGVYPRGLTVPPGQERTIPLALFSDAPTEAWELSVTTVPANAGVRVALDECHGKNGDVVHLTVRRKKTELAPVQVIVTSTLGPRTNRATLLVGR